MLVDISSLVTEDVGYMKVSNDNVTVEFEDYEDVDHISIVQPMSLVGNITCVSSQFNIDATVTFTINSQCYRCLEDVSIECSVPMKEIFEKEPKDELIYPYVGNVIDLSKAIKDVIFNNLPTQLLCKDDCLGLCFQCGCNLNESECNCEIVNTHPAMDVLNSIFD